jgi:hypothetical protein
MLAIATVAAGRGLFFRELGLNGLVLIIALVATILLVRNWGRITDWIEGHRRR